MRLRPFIVILVCSLSTLFPFSSTATTAQDRPGSMGGPVGAVSPRAEFISYDIRDLSERGEIEQNQYYRELEFNVAVDPSQGRLYSVETEIPYLWLDRQLFLVIEGLPAYRVRIQGREIGYGEDSRTPLQFDLSEYVTDGINLIEIISPDGPQAAIMEMASAPSELRAYIFSQPKVRIEDYTITLRPDSVWHHGIVDVELALANSYNTDETVRIGYDIYSPQGKLIHFDSRDITIGGNSRDTLRLSEHIWHANDNFWSARTPGLYYGQLSVRFGSKMVEYIAFQTGYGLTTLSASGEVVRNREAINISAAVYNVDRADPKTVAAEIAILKKEGINTLCPDYPQPEWFYDICDRVGTYVIDRANINSEYRTDNPEVGGAVSNDPRWLGSHLSRVERMYARSRNHSCIIARSLGGQVGNGFNMYRSYLALKALDPEAIVIFDDAAGEWNSDLPPFPKADGRALIEAAKAKPAAGTTPARKR